MNDSLDDAVAVALDKLRRRFVECSFLPGSAHKRFAASIRHRTAAEMSLAQRNLMLILAHRYRRQIPECLVPTAETVALARQALDADRAAKEVERQAKREAREAKRAQPKVRLRVTVDAHIADLLAGMEP